MWKALVLTDRNRRGWQIEQSYEFDVSCPLIFEIARVNLIIFREEARSSVAARFLNPSFVLHWAANGTPHE
ncbi:uncharacterized protein PHALS_03031 [Plasmopara halstedii]|uniref:Uncharacterized protein n=1 Tax=Plasmopara halstedii TaxID=4781 RepID=A0A0N7L3P9_PLAHL|nr:uncharacterized protein PHALS_03031 [Plasmopara halstedii]CEG36483.1 hypothetical protein PHALS_03031 [Plasmopara halstedii]|eukprot:XP_024572852.1 hypothetical protein PHALS_03031 [Plasmopara halstedii]